MDNIAEIRQDQISFKCKICEKEFKESHGLNYHFNNTHNLDLEKGHQCNICQKIFHLKNHLTTHVKSRVKFSHFKKRCSRYNLILSSFYVEKWIFPKKRPFFQRSSE